MASREIVDRIRSAIADEGDVLLAHSILGSSDPLQIADALDLYCSVNLGRRVDSVLSLEFSVGAVAGLRFTDGARALVKIHHGDTAQSALTTFADAQRFLHRSGFPCPEPIGQPAPLLNGIATTESYLDRGTHADLHDPEKRDSAASLLAELNRLLREFPRTHSLPAAESMHPRRSLWPEPHNALFDFSRNPEGAAWIDSKASEARRIIGGAAEDLIATHSDWSAKHFRFEGSTITAVYDWDSLCRSTETDSVGKAAASFTVTWYLDVDRLWPSRDEAIAFVRAYETARGSVFTQGELRRISAHAAYLILYSARCAYASPAPPEEFEKNEARRIAETISGGIYFPV